MKLIFSWLLLLLALGATAQQRIDGSFAFQTDTAKKYSLYIPSGYVEGTPHRLMLGLHPWNTSRWDAESWCDTLTAFAEANNLILACPDGGADGQVDDDIDTAFTSFLLDSMMLWYSIDPGKVYAMGFSWGGFTTYTYGLNHHGRFAGFLPIGSAMDGTNPVNGVLSNASGLPYYIVHGSQDSPSDRFTPIRDALITNGAIVETNLMSGVGHTIDFNNRNSILGVAFQWIDSVNCGVQDTSTAIPTHWTESNALKLFPSPTAHGEPVTLELQASRAGTAYVNVFNRLGQLVQRSQQAVQEGSNQFQLNTGGLPRNDTSIIVVRFGGQAHVRQLVLY